MRDTTSHEYIEQVELRVLIHQKPRGLVSVETVDLWLVVHYIYDILLAKDY